MELTG